MSVLRFKATPSRSNRAPVAFASAAAPASAGQTQWVLVWLGFILLVLLGVWLAVRNARKRD